MKRQKKLSTLLALFFMVFSICSFALELDDKLTLRMLKISNSKKTVLVNRGLEDGLVVGDHAKFFLTQGVIARGVVVKASPTRSVWSLYRIVDPMEIVSDKVMKLKISSAVKITEDKTKSLSLDSEETIASMDDEQDRRASVDSSEFSGISSQDKDEMDSLREEERYSKEATVSSPGKLGEWEIWGMLGLSSYTSEMETSATVTSTNVSSTDFVLGVERYFHRTKRPWGRRVSFSAFLNYSSDVRENAEDTSEKTSMSMTEFGIGGYWHFFSYPTELNKLLIYAGGTLALGLASQTPGHSGEDSSDGSTNFMSIGAGVKYVSTFGLGFRAFGEYFSRGITYRSQEDPLKDVAYSNSGMKLWLGLSYRF